jgi:hypothetical protein
LLAAATGFADRFTSIAASEKPRHGVVRALSLFRAICIDPIARHNASAL